MIARIWRGYAKPEHADSYAGMLEPELLPGLTAMAGYRGSYLLRRVHEAEIEFVTIILWDSLDAIRAIAGEDYERAVVPEERRRHLTRWDDVAQHYEVESTDVVRGASSGVRRP